MPLTPQTAASPALIAACRRKMWYGSEQAARRIGRDRLRENDTDKKLWPYACAHCRNWHLTSRSQHGTAITRREMWEGAGNL